MNRVLKTIIMLVCIFGITISWIAAFGLQTTAEKQYDLIERADKLISDGIYITAQPLLEEAAGYDSIHTSTAEEKLKKVYLALIDKRGYPRKYTNLLDKQMERKNASPEIFTEAAEYYLSINAKQSAYSVLKKGIEKTSDAGLTRFYESVRYSYDMGRDVYEDAKTINNQALQVQRNGKWGIADINGKIIIPFEYDKVSTFSQNRVIVQKGDAIFAVDKNNNRIAAAPEGTRDFGNLSENRASLRFDDGWKRTGADFELGTTVFEDIGTYTEGYAGACLDGKWGVIDTGSRWLVPAQYDEVIMDEHKRCYNRGAVFVRSGENVYLFSDGSIKDGTYTDARPFSDEGYAAVRRGDKWGFIDTEGNLMIEYIFDDALSFGGHIAAVKTGGLWGYVSISGKMVIDAVFADAKSFEYGSAPVRTDKGWQIITLTEFKKERIL